MRKILHAFTLLLVAGCLLGGAQSARASHLLGGDLTYTSLGGNNYRVKFRLYRDCSGITPSTFDLECRNGACNTTPTVTATLVPQGPVTAGNPFCAAVSSGPCVGPAGLPNYDVYSYQADVTLPPGNWTLSTNQNARPTLANIVGNDLYVQATLDNRLAPNGATVINNSPQFDPRDIPIQYVCWNQPTTITYSSVEADGDSLVYSLTAPLESCGTPVTYKPYPNATGGFIILSTNPRCVLLLPGNGGNFSPALPIPVGIDTIGTCPIRDARPRFIFNQQSRSISFTPSVFYPNTASADGRNKYQVAVLLTEYRRINGVRRVIGTVRREANLIVTDCGGNTTPNPVVANPVTVGSGTNAVNTTDTTRLDVYSCSYSRVQLNFTDPDNIRVPSANQLLTVTLPPNINSDPNLLDSGDVGTFAFSTDPRYTNGSTNPRGTFIFQPSPSTVGRVIRLTLRIEDNACPIKGIQNRVIVIRILKGNFATALATGGSSGLPNVTPVTLCGGSPLSLRGSVVRPDSVRNIAASTSRLQTYGYRWSLVRGDGFSNATAAQQNITVNPTVSSRYLLQITPQSGFGPGCGDTTSILVRVSPPVVARFAITDSVSSRPRTNAGQPAGGLVPPITYTFANSTTINGQLPTAFTSTVFRLDSIRWTYQRIKDGAGRLVTDAPRVFSRRYVPGNLVLAQGGTYVIRLSSASTLITNTTTARVPGQCPASVFQRIVIVPELSVPNIITPNNDNLNDVFVVPVAQRGGKLELYNRWGRKVQEYASYQNTWAGGDQPDGVYYYYLTDPTGNKTKGWVEIRRGQ